jgi:hypothetical protein
VSVDLEREPEAESARGRVSRHMGEESATSPPVLALAAAAVAIGALAGAAVAGGPYLDLDSLNPWLVLFAAALFGALMVVPFAANHLLRGARSERAEAWEGAMVAWGAVAVVALGVGLVPIALGGFDPADSLADAVGLLLTIEAGLVAVTLLVWVLSG